jgi:hypothetical protein
MSIRVLEGGGILGGYSFEFETHECIDRNSGGSAEPDSEIGASALLLSELERVNAAYRRTAPSDDSRECAISALNAIVDLLPHVVPGAELAVIEDLSWQLSDLDSGITGRFLAKPKTEIGGSPPRGIHAAVLRVFSAVYMSMVMDAGLSENEANELAKAASASRARRAGVTLKRSTIKHWRKQLRSRKDDEDAPLYDYFWRQWRLQSPEMRTVQNAGDWIKDQFGD